MKKALVIVLAVALIMGMAVPAYAASSLDEDSPLARIIGIRSPSASEDDLKPFLITASSKVYGICSIEEISELSEEAQQVFIEALETLEDLEYDGMSLRYYIYFYTDEPCTALFLIEDVSELVFVQYVDGEWVELKHTINGDGTIFVEGVVDAPMAIFVK